MVGFILAFGRHSINFQSFRFIGILLLHDLNSLNGTSDFGLTSIAEPILSHSGTRRV